ncbi:uncharacterized protein LOC142776279 isoform X3 [Rhipicephalus microplus]|uniref:uncharacterized protein LOC142776279 isoform X3 n=1 Tax=Rhipicephalus microplus TaxID=6941 RepID=UPI003F6C2A47
MGREKWPPKRARLCEDHFTIYQFEEDSLAGRKRLKPAAVPSIFCAHQSAIVSDNSRSSMAPDKSEEAGLSPSKLGGTGAQQSVDTSQHSLPASQGILHEVFAALKEKVATMAAEERHACFLMNEMQISPSLDYDVSTGNIIGQPTVCPSNPSTNDQLANHALVFVCAGLTNRR